MQRTAEQVGFSRPGHRRHNPTEHLSRQAIDSSVEGPLLLTVEEVRKLIGLSVRQIHRLKSLGTFPKEVRIGGSVRWRRVDIEEWVAAGCR